MNRQDGRCTAAFESKRFPYFTINVTKRSVLEGNHGGIMAFYERMRFVEKYRLALDLMEVVVTSDAEFLVEDEDSVQALMHWLNLLAIENEASVTESPHLAVWEVVPFDFRPLQKGWWPGDDER